MAKTIKQNGLDSILATLMEDTLRADEFTAKMVYEKQLADGGGKTYDSIRCKLERMARNGDLKSRMTTVNGARSTAYSLA